MALLNITTAGPGQLDLTPAASTVLAFDASGNLQCKPRMLQLPATLPEVAATPDAQDIVDALVTLGLVTQAEA